MLVIEGGDGELAGRWLEQICDLYDAVFSEQPFVWSPEDSAAHRRLLTELTSDPTLGITIAWQDGDLVGFAYGYRLPATHAWWSGFPAPLPDDFVAEWEGRTFTLADFGVERLSRGRGIGRRLHDSLLAGRSEERVVLSVQPTALLTRQIYERWGWHHVGRKGPMADVRPPYWDIYVRPLG
jgi:GNAT superfamily N-acetyltransferase